MFAISGRPCHCSDASSCTMACLSPASSGRQRWRNSRGIGISTAIERPKKAPGHVCRGPKHARLGGLSARCRRLWVRGWRVGRSLAISGARDATGISGFTLMLAMTLRHSAQHRPGRRVAAAHSDSYPTAPPAKQRSAAPPRAPDPWAAAEGPTPGEQGSSGSPAAPGWRR